MQFVFIRSFVSALILSGSPILVENRFFMPDVPYFEVHHAHADDTRSWCLLISAVEWIRQNSDPLYYCGEYGVACSCLHLLHSVVHGAVQAADEIVCECVCLDRFWK